MRASLGAPASRHLSVDRFRDAAAIEPNTMSAASRASMTSASPPLVSPTSRPLSKVLRTSRRNEGSRSLRFVVARRAVMARGARNRGSCVRRPRAARDGRRSVARRAASRARPRATRPPARVLRTCGARACVFEHGQVGKSSKDGHQTHPSDKPAVSSLLTPFAGAWRASPIATIRDRTTRSTSQRKSAIFRSAALRPRRASALDLERDSG